MAIIYNNKGVVLFKLGKYEEAIEIYNKALELNPIFIYALLMKGYSLHRMGKKEEAKEIFKIAYEIDKNETKGFLEWDLSQYKKMFK